MHHTTNQVAGLCVYFKVMMKREIEQAWPGGSDATLSPYTYSRITGVVLPSSAVLAEWWPCFPHVTIVHKQSIVPFYPTSQ